MRILVIGSSNTDMVVKANHLPVPGETILGGKFIMNAGGKGANQAVAAARLGGIVTFIAKTGNDIFGNQALQMFEKEGINTSYMLKDPNQPSGVALITVDKNGENCIVVAPGANGTLSISDIEKFTDAIRETNIILLQLETPVDTVEYIAKLGFGLGKKVVLNPAPAQFLNEKLLQALYLITPNQTEAEMLSGIKITTPGNEHIDGLKIDGLASVERAAAALHAKGVQNIVITLGSSGAYVFSAEYKGLVPGRKVTPVDTTAAGDTFSGALVVALSEGKTIKEAVEFANLAASISVTRMGAQSSIPFRKELY